MITGKPLTALAAGGLTPEIVVKAEIGSTVTANGMQPTEIVPELLVSEYYFKDLPLGTYTISASKGDKSDTVSVVVDRVKQYRTEIRYPLYIALSGQTNSGAGYITINGTKCTEANIYTVRSYDTISVTVGGTGIYEATDCYIIKDGVRILDDSGTVDLTVTDNLTIVFTKHSHLLGSGYSCEITTG